MGAIYEDRYKHKNLSAFGNSASPKKCSLKLPTDALFKIRTSNRKSTLIKLRRFNIFMWCAR